MSDSIFRPLFVELPRAVMDGLKEVGQAFEAAIAEAAKPKAPEPPHKQSLLHSLAQSLDQIVIEMLRKKPRFPWKGCTAEVTRNAMHALILIRIRRPCRHSFDVVLEEDAMYLRAGSVRETFDYVWDRVETEAEKNIVCDRCVKAMRLGPAGRGQ